MRPFAYQPARDAADAVRSGAMAQGGGSADMPPTSAPIQFLAGGTTIIDLMKLDVMRPATLVDITPLSGAHSEIAVEPSGLRLGALARMADVASHPDVIRDYPAIAQSLMLAASAQLRNMATLGGNVLQRTRCTYFRDTSWAQCNKRNPGSGCAAMEGVNRTLAILGTSDHCIASYPGDWAAALIALDASVEILSGAGSQRILFAELHRAPGDTPHIETVLHPGELIIGFSIPSGAWTRRSLYLKVRDRQSYEFALAGAAVALDIQDGTVNEARIGLSGLATTPWRAHAAEDALRGKKLDEQSAEAAAAAAMSGAQPRGENAFKEELGRRTIVRALLAASRLEV